MFSTKKTLYVPGVNNRSPAMKSVHLFSFHISFQNEILYYLNVWSAPPFNTKHCTVPHDL